MASRVSDKKICKDNPEKTELKDVGVSIYRYKINVGDVEEKTKNTGKQSVNAANIFLVVDKKENDGRPDQEHDKGNSTCKRCQFAIQERLLESNKDILSGICDHCRAKLKIEADVQTVWDKVLSKIQKGRHEKEKTPDIPSWYRPTMEKTDETFKKKIHEHLRAQRRLEDEDPRRLRTKYFSEDSLIVPFPHLRELSEDESFDLEQGDVRGITWSKREPVKRTSSGSLPSRETSYEKDISDGKQRAGRRMARQFGIEDRQIDEVIIDKDGKKVVQSCIGSTQTKQDGDFDLTSLAESKQKDKRRGHKSAHEIRLSDTKVRADKESRQDKGVSQDKLIKTQTSPREATEIKSKAKVEKETTDEKQKASQTTPREAAETKSKPKVEKETMDEKQKISGSPKGSLESRSKAKEEKQEQVSKSQTLPKPSAPKESATKSATMSKSPSVSKVKAEGKIKTQDEKQGKQEQPGKSTALSKPEPKTPVEGKIKQQDEKETKHEKVEKPYVPSKEAPEAKAKPQTEEKMKHDLPKGEAEKPGKTKDMDGSKDTKAEKAKGTEVSEKLKHDKSKTEQHEKPSTQKESDKSGKGIDDKSGKTDISKQKDIETKTQEKKETNVKETKAQEKEKNVKPPGKGKSDSKFEKEDEMKSERGKQLQKGDNAESQQKTKDGKPEKGLTKDQKHVDKTEETLKKKQSKEKEMKIVMEKNESKQMDIKVRKGDDEKRTIEVKSVGAAPADKDLPPANIAQQRKISEDKGKKKVTDDKSEETGKKKEPKEKEMKIVMEKTDVKEMGMKIRKGEEEKRIIEVKSVGAAPAAKDLPPANIAQQLKDLEEKAKKKAADDTEKRPKHPERELKMNEVIMAAEVDTLRFAIPKQDKKPTAVIPELPPIPGQYALKEVMGGLPEDPAAFQSKIDRHKAKSVSRLTIRDEAILKKYISSDRDKATLKKLTPVMVDSELALDLESLLNASEKEPSWTNQMIKGTQIVPRDEKALEEDKRVNPPMLFHMKKLPEESLATSRDTSSKKAESDQGDRQPLSYALSDRTFIEKGWTVLPTEKVLRKMNIYRMRPSRPKFDWFQNNKNKGVIKYDTGEKLAEFDDDGRARCYYKNGRLALNYYDTEETNAQQRYVVYSSGEQDSKGRSRPVTILAMFDYSGNGIVFDHNGKIRLKYNQSEGVVLDRSLGPVTHWKWHSLNDPPVLQQVMIDTHMMFKDPEIVKLGENQEDHKQRPADDEAMLAIEFENFVKEKTKKLSAKFLPYQIKMKALEINEQFSLKILDQATIYLLYRDGNTHLKLNLGMTLDHHEIVDTETVELGEVSSSLEKYPAKSTSLEQLQLCLMNTKRTHRVRTERDSKINRPVGRTVESADELEAARTKPLHPANVRLATGDHQCRYRRKEPTTVLYYNTGLI